MIRFAAIAMAVLLSACAGRQTVPAEGGPLNPLCADACAAPCLPAEWPQWECADPNAPECWDRQPETVAIPLQAIARQCDAGRRACLSCLQRLEALGVLCGVTSKCGG